jgi:hypothetical protein
MVYRTLEGTLHPDGRILLSEGELPPKPVRVLVTLLDDEDSGLLELGDYLDQLNDYEERLARGEIRWQ